MNNTDIAALVAEQHSISKADAKAIVDSVFTAVTDAAARDEEVTINGFGKFKVKKAAAREGRNPATGETIQIAASKNKRPPTTPSTSSRFSIPTQTFR